MDSSAKIKQATDSVCQLFDGKVAPDAMRTLKDTLYLQFKTMHHLIELVPLLVGTEHKDALITDYVKHSYDLVKQASRESFAQLPRQFPPDGYFSPARSLPSQSPYNHSPHARIHASPAGSVYWTPPQQVNTPKAPHSTPSSNTKPLAMVSMASSMTETPKMASMEDQTTADSTSSSLAQMAAAMGVIAGEVAEEQQQEDEQTLEQDEEPQVEQEDQEQHSEVSPQEQEQSKQVADQEQPVGQSFDQKENRAPPRRRGVLGMFDDPNEEAYVYEPPPRRAAPKEQPKASPLQQNIEQLPTPAPSFEVPAGQAKKAEAWTVGYVELEEEAERLRKLKEKQKASVAATQIAWTVSFGEDAAAQPKAKPQIPASIAARLSRNKSASSLSRTSNRPQTARTHGSRAPLTNRSNVGKKTGGADPSKFLKRNSGSANYLRDGSMTSR
mmetsp:Transcript_45872/g.90389  ORF Transcript_45872/g.90389 Transcript_45872/m.90389 type:complete len:441 (-) Transcript_45872:2389-3711(-)